MCLTGYGVGVFLSNSNTVYLTAAARYYDISYCCIDKSISVRFCFLEGI